MVFDALLKAELLERYMPEVQKIARQVASKLPSNVELDDLFQVGMIGLMDALQRYTEGESTFEAYAHFRIRGAIMDDLREKDHLPRAVRQMRKQFESVQQKLAHQLGRTPQEAEVALALNVDLDTFRKSRALFEQADELSIDEFGDEDNSAQAMLDRLAEPSSSAEDELDEREHKEGLLSLLENLSDREQLVLRMHFEQEMTFKEIGGVMGVNESRAYQMHTAALANLREAARPA